MIRLSRVKDETDNEPTIWEGTWEDLARECSAHRPSSSKVGVTGWCGAVFNGLRRQPNVIEIGVIFLDFDNLTWEQAADAMARLQPYRRIIYSSYSHLLPGKGVRFRAILFPDRPIKPREWLTVWRGVRDELAPSVDNKTGSNVAALYFAPTCPPEMIGEAFTEVSDGALVNVDRYAETTEGVAPRDGTIPIRLDQLQKVAAKWQKRSSLTMSFLGGVLESVCSGVPYAPEGERDSVTWRLCCELAREIPEAESESLGALFAASLSQMGDGAPKPADVAEKFRRARAAVAEGAAAVKDWREIQISSIFRGARSEPYSLEEIRAWGVRENEWALSYSRTELWLAFDGTYQGPFIRANEECLAYLAAAPFPVVRVSEAGSITWRTVREVLAAHGRQVRNKINHIGGRGRARYDRSTDTLHTYACPLRDLPARYDAEVDAWLGALCGSAKGDVLRWLAACVDPDARLPLLWFVGPAGVGKSLFAAALNRLWSQGGPGDAREAVGGNYNAELLKSPLLLADEALPRDWRGNVPTDRIRQMLTSGTHTVNEKFGTKGEVTGAVRLIVTSNSVETFAGPGTRAADIEALSARILQVTCPAGMLRADRAESFVQDDRFASHVHWLAASRPVEGRGAARFAVGGSVDFVTSLFIRSGSRPAILAWLCRYLQRPETHINQRLHTAVWVEPDGSIWVNRDLFTFCWGDYYGGERLNSQRAGEISDELAELIEGNKRLKRKGVQYRQLNRDYIEAHHMRHWDEPADTARALEAQAAKDKSSLN